MDTNNIANYSISYSAHLHVKSHKHTQMIARAKRVENAAGSQRALYHHRNGLLYTSHDDDRQSNKNNR